MKKFQKKTMDGNMAAAHIAYAFSEMAMIYPITPSSPMADYADAWSVAGRKNIWGQRVRITEMQSEAGAAGALHGVVKAGSLATTFTASQGLLLMVPNMYKMAGEMLPVVIHVAARAVATSALSIFGDQSDVMSTRSTGFAMLAESSVQEAMDLSAVAHLATIEGSVPFLNFFDGFRTSHEVQKIDVLDYADLAPLINQEKLAEFRARSVNPDHPSVSGTNQNPDIYFQQREIVNPYYEALPAIVEKYMAAINELRGTDYDLVNYYGAPDATEVIVSIGSVAGTIKQTVDYLNAQGRKVGFINVHLYRPFPTAKLLEKLPETVKSVAVLDRTKEAGASGEPLFLDVQSTLFGKDVKIIGGRYGIGSKDTRPEHIVAVFDELLKESAQQKKHFTIGIEDDQTHLSLAAPVTLDLTPADTYQAKFWGFGSDGTVGANKAAIKIIGDHTDKFVQAAFEYDSKKSGGLTVSHLRFGDSPILSEYSIAASDFVSCANQTYVRKYDLLKGLKKSGIFLLNTNWPDGEQLEAHLSNSMKAYLAQNEIQFYTINAEKIAQDAGLGRRINTVMQVAFFKLTNIMPFDEAYELLKADAQKYARKSPTIVESNLNAMAQALSNLHKVEVPAAWADLTEPAEKPVTADTPRKKYVFNFLDKVNAFEGDSLTVKALDAVGLTHGAAVTGTSASEKRGIALEVPEFNPEFCIQCNECAFVCPHAAIRPFLVDEDEWNVAPEGFRVMDYTKADGLKYRIQVSVEDCTGCGLCVEACPKSGQALKMVPYETQKEQAVNWAFAMTLKQKANPFEGRPATVVSTQFNQPLLEFSGACSGCGETPYIKLLTQMFGDRMMIANATGCSSIYGGSQATPYATNADEHGPAWSNSLFEDNAEYGYGMHMANVTRRLKLREDILASLNDMSEDLQNLAKDWAEHLFDSDGTRARAEKMKALLTQEHGNSAALESIYQQQDLLVKPTQWIFGGDGWAYDIGYGGLDHVISTGADVNILVMDNEVYANTGGQVSKATPASAIAQFAAGGKVSAKKDLGAMAMTYGNVYVAQIASGANMMQTIKTFAEAEAHKGPSVIIAYTPCITHGLYAGMNHVLEEAKAAVNSGYWQLYRYNPDLEEAGKNPMTLDFKRPDFSQVHDFLLTQARFGSLKKVNAEHAEALYAKAAKGSRRRFLRYARMSGDYDKFIAREEKAAAKAE
ncbi:pyruvate:ferredoxin (flavodoxin) oxidoreductase [Lactovum odontotermitis]